MSSARSFRREAPAVADGVEALVGRTPLVRLNSHGVEGVEIWAKLEFFNPGGSVKDRPAVRMVRRALEDGLLEQNRALLDATSGNTGIAYAWMGACLGLRVVLAIPENCSEERKRILRAFGAEVHFSDPMEGSDGAILLARKIRDADPDRYFVPDQYNNPENPESHARGTAEEILEQIGDRLTHFAAGIGTSGTLMGTGRVLRERRPGVRIVALEPSEPFHGLEGWKHMASSIVPGIYDESGFDEKISVDTEEAYEWAKVLARREGILAGPSAGGAYAGCVHLARRIGKGCIVTVFADSGDKYLHSKLWD